MSDKIDNHELIEVFYGETQELIDKMRKDLLALDEGRETASAILYRLFRYAHIIKSSAAIVGFEDLGKVVRALEKIFKTASNEKFIMTVDVISLLSESVEACQKLLNEEEVVGYIKLLERLNSVLQP